MSAPFIIGGGEIVQSVWFELKGLGAKSPSSVLPLIGLIGNHLNCSVEERQTLFDRAWRTGMFSWCSKAHKEAANGIFLRAFSSVHQFLQTNVPSLCGAKSVILGYSAGSLTVQRV